MKRKPTGFIAICQCKEIIGALDYNRTDRKEAGKILGKWLADGCTIIPKFSHNWHATISICRCNDPRFLIPTKQKEKI